MIINCFNRVSTATNGRPNKPTDPHLERNKIDLDLNI
jgi:hypothetical protein